jgi:hypothetical protein
MSKRIKKHAETLKLLAKSKGPMATRIVAGADRELINCLCECAKNVIKGHVKLTAKQKAKLKTHKNGIRRLVKKKVSLKTKKKILQKGGFLPALLAPIAGAVLGPLLGRLFNRGQ